MTELKFNGISPGQKYLRIGIQGNNKVDKLVLIVDAKQGEIDLSVYKPSLKVANKTLTYADIFSDLERKDDKEAETIQLTLALTDEITQNESVDMQLVFKDYSSEEDVLVWQTKYFNVAFDETVQVDRVIEKRYPDILNKIEKKLDRVEALADAKANTVVQKKTYLEFPNIGSAGCLYLDLTTHIAYHWDEEEKKYFKVSGSADIDYINILDANGGNE